MSAGRRAAPTCPWDGQPPALRDDGQVLIAPLPETLVVHPGVGKGHQMPDAPGSRCPASSPLAGRSPRSRRRCSGPRWAIPRLLISLGYFSP